VAPPFSTSWWLLEKSRVVSGGGVKVKQRRSVGSISGFGSEKE